MSRSAAALAAVPLLLVAALPGAGQGVPARTAPRAAAWTGEAPDARAAFELMKSLEGDWTGASTEVETGAVHLRDARFEYRLTGAGSALLELAYAGTPEEMLSVFALDGDRLLLHHYCTAGNRPVLELVEASERELVFELAEDAESVDAAREGHIHGARFVFRPDGRVDAFWSWYEDGREDHANRRALRRR